jgi:hypothetical protein
MSEEIATDDGPYIICEALYAVRAGQPYEPTVKGNCFDCKKPMARCGLMVVYTPHQLKLSAQCHRCGYVNTVVIATITTLKCEPSSNPAPTSPTSLAIAAEPSF